MLNDTVYLRNIALSLEALAGTSGAEENPTVSGYLKRIQDATEALETNSPRVIAQSAVAVSHTGDINETTLATIAVPAGVMGINGQIEITASWSMTSSTNARTMRTKFGAMQLGGLALTTALASAQTFSRVANRNDAAVQVGGSASAASNPFSANANALTTGTVDTTAAVDITLTAQLAAAGETITLESYIVKVWPAA